MPGLSIGLLEVLHNFLFPLLRWVSLVFGQTLLKVSRLEHDSCSCPFPANSSQCPAFLGHLSCTVQWEAGNQGLGQWGLPVTDSVVALEWQYRLACLGEGTHLVCPVLHGGMAWGAWEGLTHGGRKGNGCEVSDNFLCLKWNISSQCMRAPLHHTP